MLQKQKDASVEAKRRDAILKEEEKRLRVSCDDLGGVCVVCVCVCVCVCE